MTSSSATEVVADSNQVIKNADALDLHRFLGLKIFFREVIIHQIVG